MSRLENTYNEDCVGQLYLDWDEYEEIMRGHDQHIVEDAIKYEDHEVQKVIREWNPDGPAEPVQEDWLF